MTTFTELAHSLWNGNPRATAEAIADHLNLTDEQQSVGPHPATGQWVAT